MANFCTNCGTPNTDGTKFCTSCGNPLPEAAPVQQPVQEPVYAQQPVQQPVYAQQPVQQPQYQQPQYQQPQYQQPQGYPQPPVQQGYPQQQPQGYYQPGYTGFSEAPKKSKKGLVIAIVVILLLGLAAIALFVWPGFLNGGSGGLSGTWVSNDGTTIKIDGSKLVGANGQTYKLETSGNKFNVIDEGEDEVEEYLYKLDGDTLTLYDTEDTGLTQPIVVFTRQGGSGNKGGSGGSDEPDTPVYGDPDDLLQGLWEDDYGFSSYEFDDGDVTIGALGMTFDGTYEIDGDKLTITYEVMGYDTTLEYTFEVNGDELTLTDSSNITQVFKRK